MRPVGESSGHLEGYVLVVEGNVEGVVFTDGKPFGSLGYRVRRHMSQLKRSTFPVQSLQAQEKGQQNQESRQPDQRDKSIESVQ